MLIGTTPPGVWAAEALIGWLEVDWETARRLVELSWPLGQCVADIVEVDTELTQALDLHSLEGDAVFSQEASTASEQTLLERIVLGHRIFHEAMLLWFTLPAVPRRLLPDSFPHKVLERVSALSSGPIVEDACTAARELLARHPTAD